MSHSNPVAQRSRPARERWLAEVLGYDPKDVALDLTDKITVCDGCRTAYCWLGDLMCWDAKTCATVEITVDQAIHENREHPSTWVRLRRAEGHPNA